MNIIRMRMIPKLRRFSNARDATKNTNLKYSHISNKMKKKKDCPDYTLKISRCLCRLLFTIDRHVCHLRVAFLFRLSSLQQFAYMKLFLLLFAFWVQDDLHLQYGISEHKLHGVCFSVSSDRRLLLISVIFQPQCLFPLQIWYVWSSVKRNNEDCRRPYFMCNFGVFFFCWANNGFCDHHKIGEIQY